MAVMREKSHRCSCGAAGDLGDLGDHMVVMLQAPDDTREHRWLDGQEPERVTQVRGRQERAAQVREALADAAGVSVEELRDALR